MSKYPIGTKAYSSIGDHWLKIGEGKWKAQSGCVFPRYGGDAVRFELPKYLDKSEITDALCQELGRVPCEYRWLPWLDWKAGLLARVGSGKNKYKVGGIPGWDSGQKFPFVRILRSTVDEMRKAKEAE